MAIKSRKEDFSDGFDVTVQNVIGRVSFGDGNEHPHVAALTLIGQHSMGEPGVYRFPMESSHICVVEIAHEDPPQGA